MVDNNNRQNQLLEKINKRSLWINNKQCIDRYLYPDQILFGHLFNPNIKCPHQYQLSKSSLQLPSPDQLIIYQKKMSQTKIKSMLNMMQGNHPPLFKSSVLPKTHLERHQQSDGEESYQEEDDYEDYDEDMYLNENDYENNFEEEYDDEENPIMAFGGSMGGLGKLKNYAQEFNYLPDANAGQKQHNPMLFRSQQPTLSKREQGLAQALKLNPNLLMTNKASTLNNSKTNNKDKKPTENQSQEDWETDSEEEVQSQEQNKNKK